MSLSGECTRFVNVLCGGVAPVSVEGRAAACLNRTPGGRGFFPFSLKKKLHRKGTCGGGAISRLPLLGNIFSHPQIGWTYPNICGASVQLGNRLAFQQIKAEILE